MTAHPHALRTMPKVELHVHFEGSLQADTVLTLARKHNIALPADTADGLRAWYTFIDFPHFADIYGLNARCLQTPDDLEFATRAFLTEQARQNIVYSEVTYTAFARHISSGMAWRDQLGGIQRGIAWGRETLNVDMQLIVDIDRDRATPQDAIRLAEWIIDTYAGGENDIAALGLGGYEVGFPPEMFADALKLAFDAGVPLVLHAGETDGAASIWGAIHAGAVRLGHGVRCFEDPQLVEYLRDHQIPLEVCPTSNICLGVVPDMASHPIQRMIDAGLYVTLNSDDPPMFDVTLNDEYVRTAETFGWTLEDYQQLVLKAAQATLLPEPRKSALIARLHSAFATPQETL
jgi:adenosine deaminase